MAIEVKTGENKLSEKQLRNYHRHIKTQAPHATISWLCRSWRRDISSTLGSILEDAQTDIPNEGRFLLKELGRYLEMEGLGVISFRRDDFLDWDNSALTLQGKIEALGHALLADGCLVSHHLNKQNRQAHYLGVNLLHDEFGHSQNYSVPHWSLGLERYERRLRLFVQCEGKPLTKRLVSQRQQLTEDLLPVLSKLRDEPRVQLRVRQKWHVMQAGKGERAPLYPVYFASPIACCQSEKSLRDVVGTALDAVDSINNSRGQIAGCECLKQFKGRTLVGVLQLDFSLNWFELEDLGIGVEDRLRGIVPRMKDYYEVIRRYAAG